MNLAVVPVVERVRCLVGIEVARAEGQECYGRGVKRAALFVCLLAATARADSNDVVSRSIVVGRGAVAAELTVEVNLAHSFKAEPLSFAPDVWWGATDALTVGLVHSNASLDRFEPGASICVRTDDVLYCDSPYRGSGVDARYRVVEQGAFELAPRARVLVRDVDPFKPALTLGALGKWTRGRYAITFDPYLQLGLANQERGNRAQLWLPVELALQPTCRWQLALSTGWNSVLDVIEDGWHIPVAVGVRARATAHVDVGATLGFATLLGPQNTPKQRVLFVSVGWR